MMNSSPVACSRNLNFLSPKWIEGVNPLIASGGDWTDAGDYATPVQCAYLYRDGKLVGRLPEFNLAVKLNDLFGKDFVGVSADRFFGERRLVFHGTVQ